MNIGYRTFNTDLSDILNSGINYERKLDMLAQWIKYLRSTIAYWICVFDKKLAALQAWVLDLLSNLIHGGNGITATYDSSTNTWTISSNLEAGPGITITPNPDGSLEITNSDHQAVLDLEQCCDDVKNQLAHLIKAGSGIDVEYDTATGTYTISNTCCAPTIVGPGSVVPNLWQFTDVSDIAFMNAHDIDGNPIGGGAINVEMSDGSFVYAVAEDYHCFSGIGTPGYGNPDQSKTPIDSISVWYAASSARNIAYQSGVLNCPLDIQHPGLVVPFQICPPRSWLATVNGQQVPVAPKSPVLIPCGYSSLIGTWPEPTYPGGIAQWETDWSTGTNQGLRPTTYPATNKDGMLRFNTDGSWDLITMPSLPLNWPPAGHLQDTDTTFLINGMVWTTPDGQSFDPDDPCNGDHNNTDAYYSIRIDLAAFSVSLYPI